MLEVVDLPQRGQCCVAFWEWTATGKTDLRLGREPSRKVYQVRPRRSLRARFLRIFPSDVPEQSKQKYSPRSQQYSFALCRGGTAIIIGVFNTYGFDAFDP